ncbi:MAG: hypothetical protein RLZZ455_443 [Candidatus Parcubacteria bacterium]|jgi:hypothetical protein
MKGKELLLIAISSFFLTVIWISSNVYHAYATSTIDSLLKIQTLPIAPNFDMATIEKLKKRSAIVPSTSSSLAPTPELSPTPTTEITIEETPITLSEDEVATLSITQAP